MDLDSAPLTTVEDRLSTPYLALLGSEGWAYLR